MAYDILENLDFTVEEINSLVSYYPNESLFGEYAGAFISAAYNLSEEKEIVYDIETDHVLDRKSVV